MALTPDHMVTPVLTAMVTVPADHGVTTTTRTITQECSAAADEALTTEVDPEDTTVDPRSAKASPSTSSATSESQ
jgi:hypothetical protein